MRFHTPLHPSFSTSPILHSNPGPQHADEIASSPRFAALSALASVHGVGPVTARKLYDLGIRSIEDARVYYSVEKGDSLHGEGEGENYPVKVGLALAEELELETK